MISKEALIVLHGAKIKMTEKDRQIIKDNISYRLDWGKFLYYCIHHRVSSLVLKNLKELEAIKYIEKHVLWILKNEASRIKEHNEGLYKEIDKINYNFQKEGIKAVMLKGALLASVLYKDVSLRQYADADYLVKGKDTTKVTEILTNLGYIQGSFEVNKEQIIPATRAEKILHRMNSHELTSFFKKSDQINSGIYSIDVNFSITWKEYLKNQGKQIVDTNELVDTAESVEISQSNSFCLKPEYQILQLCAHLFSEAVFFCWDTDWIKDKGDLNLIKFCDINEFILSREIDWEELESVTIRNNMQEPVYYTLCLVKKLFDCTIPESFFNAMNLDISVIDRFYDKNGNERYWKLPFFDRLFNINDKVEEVLSEGIL